MRWGGGGEGGEEGGDDEVCNDVLYSEKYGSKIYVNGGKVRWGNGGEEKS